MASRFACVTSEEINQINFFGLILSQLFNLVSVASGGYLRQRFTAQ